MYIDKSVQRKKVNMVFYTINIKKIILNLLAKDVHIWKLLEYVG